MKALRTPAYFTINIPRSKGPKRSTTRRKFDLFVLIVCCLSNMPCKSLNFSARALEFFCVWKKSSRVPDNDVALIRVYLFSNRIDFYWLTLENDVHLMLYAMEFKWTIQSVELLRASLRFF